MASGVFKSVVVASDFVMANIVHATEIRKRPETPPEMHRANDNPSISELEADWQPEAAFFAQNFRQSIISRYKQGKDLNPSLRRTFRQRHNLVPPRHDGVSLDRFPSLPALGSQASCPRRPRSQHHRSATRRCDGLCLLQPLQGRDQGLPDPGFRKVRL